MGKFKNFLSTIEKRRSFYVEYGIPSSVKIRKPFNNDRDSLPQYIKIPVLIVTECGIRFPLDPFLREFFCLTQLHPSQLAPNSFRILGAVIQLNTLLESKLTVSDILCCYSISLVGSGKYYMSSKTNRTLIHCIPTSCKDVDYMLVYGDWEFPSSKFGAATGHRCPRVAKHLDKIPAFPDSQISKAVDFVLNDALAAISPAGKFWRSAPVLMGCAPTCRTFNALPSGVNLEEANQFFDNFDFTRVGKPSIAPPLTQPFSEPSVESKDSKKDCGQDNANFSPDLSDDDIPFDRVEHGCAVHVSSDPDIGTHLRSGPKLHMGNASNCSAGVLPGSPFPELRRPSSTPGYTFGSQSLGKPVDPGSFQVSDGFSTQSTSMPSLVHELPPRPFLSSNIGGSPSIDVPLSSSKMSGSNLRIASSQCGMSTFPSIFEDSRLAASQLRSSIVAGDMQRFREAPLGDTIDSALQMVYGGAQMCSYVFDRFRNSEVEVNTLKRKLSDSDMLLDVMRQKVINAERKLKTSSNLEKRLSKAEDRLAKTQEKLSKAQEALYRAKEEKLKAVKAREAECCNFYSEKLASESNHFFGLGWGNALWAFGVPLSSEAWLESSIPWPSPDLPHPDVKNHFLGNDGNHVKKVAPSPTDGNQVLGSASPSGSIPEEAEPAEAPSIVVSDN